MYTRTLADVTHRVPEIVEVVRALPVEAVILDGETLSLDDDGAPRPFQDTMARFGAEAAREIALRPWFFDILHLDGSDLVDEPSERASTRSSGWRRPGASRPSLPTTPTPQTPSRATPWRRVTRAS